MTRLALLTLLVAAACGGGNKEQPTRSPSYDYPAQAPTTSDGDTVGADRQSTSDKLETGPSVGSEGVKTPDAGAPEGD